MCWEVSCGCGYECRDHKITDLTCPKCGKMMTAIEQESHDKKWINSRSQRRLLTIQKRAHEH